MNNHKKAIQLAVETKQSQLKSGETGPGSPDAKCDVDLNSVSLSLWEWRRARVVRAVRGSFSVRTETICLMLKQVVFCFSADLL